MLQEFLNANLLPITDESYFEKLKKTADQLAKKLTKNKSKILSYTLTSLDPEISPDNPDLIEVKEIITKNWSTFTTNSKDTVVTVIRAVMLEVLEILSKEMEINLACLIWLSGRNVVKYFNLIGKEKEIVINFLLSLGNQVENVAVENWMLPPDSKFQQLSIDIKEFNGALVDKATLQKLFAWASGPNDDQSVVTFKEPNSVWPNSGASWSYQFAPKAALAISQEVNKVLKEQAKQITISQTQIQEVVNKLLSQLQSEILKRNSLLQMRTQLLWWKESCYSISINQGYRQQENGVLQILLATDYSIFVPTIYPTSANYFLKETHRTLVKDENEKIKISEILKQVELSKEIIKNIFEEPSIIYGRISLHCFIKGLVWGKCTLEQFKALVGFDESVEITLSDFTVWLFHDLQSLKISTSK
jgi:GTPase-associated system helical domain